MHEHTIHIRGINDELSTQHVTFSLKAWDEKPYNELPGELKMTRSSVAYTYQGDIEGESTLDYLMVYRPDESGSFVGLERVIGRVGWAIGQFCVTTHGHVQQDRREQHVFCSAALGHGRVDQSARHRERSICPDTPNATR